MWLEILLASVLGFIIYWFISRDREEILPFEDGWWGPGVKTITREDESIRPFKVETSDEEINDLHQRIDKFRLTPPLEDSRFHYGFNSNYLKKILSYWRNEFDWRKQVEFLNKYPHFKTKIEGLDIHFIHVKPPQLPSGRTPKTLLMVHGWPGSFYEFYKIIPLLTDPKSHGLSDEHIFEVICPSIPGYGFSEASYKKGFNTVACARIFYKLMLRLGFQKFYIQGGDWGSLICTNMAQLVPRHVKGLHLNMAFVARNLSNLTLLLGQRFAGFLGFTERDVELMFPWKDKIFYNITRESGYLHIQATKPDTVGCALNDSPVGLAAYILEKFSTWTNSEFRNLEDGGLERKFSLNDLLTNIMLYWTTKTIVSSQRFYKENLGQGMNQKHERMKVFVPTGFAAFPCEILHVPEKWLKSKFPKLISYSYMAAGGHFAAFEEPKLLAQDIRKFVTLVEQQ
ncbi:epoxide hydrolase 1, transcript variant X2 [Ictidomys tridecemlineatus]|uniref:Epoxide hydrolase n=1 Tax=Ictidomys tridecemlineatus TaxID=43179 RepID=I3MVG1_ICTTR|nr:epoxide hydrolase 1 [Ictidomys tridecemlineatus]XP_021582840.1 epoxide hydrolase 1 [Ictidomys tridecemlineatus]XP_040134034.1 epoxide hydrolase 1 [Ictidomys tridecemlineatus]XP_040134035.1 epoxide hydrolase 1 [Ictidomys tridecemlineatus]KAG3258008.1 epoxide hydrolase 1, transcript variant X1 [Ictidomys tridecemlineatus]KAG3258009.1 epoxide hydrolase 1, transcript variant X2 [Ictidomys tridecemlineatus]